MISGLCFFGPRLPAVVRAGATWASVPPRRVHTIWAVLWYFWTAVAVPAGHIFGSASACIVAAGMDWCRHRAAHTGSAAARWPRGQWRNTAERGSVVVMRVFDELGAHERWPLGAQSANRFHSRRRHHVVHIGCPRAQRAGAPREGRVVFSNVSLGNCAIAGTGRRQADVAVACASAARRRARVMQFSARLPPARRGWLCVTAAAC